MGNRIREGEERGKRSREQKRKKEKKTERGIKANATKDISEMSEREEIIKKVEQNIGERM